MNKHLFSYIGDPVYALGVTFFGGKVAVLFIVKKAAAVALPRRMEHGQRQGQEEHLKQSPNIFLMAPL